MNFVSNAVKFSSEGSSIIVNVSTDESYAQKLLRTPLPDVSQAVKSTVPGSPKGDGSVSLGNAPECRWMTVSVEDQGMGMTGQELLRLFKPYNQASRSISVQFGGSGLGLCYVQSIVAAMNGYTQVTTRQGRGSCFCIVFPVLVSSERDRNAAADAASPSSRNTNSSSPKAAPSHYKRCTSPTGSQISLFEAFSTEFGESGQSGDGAQGQSGARSKGANGPRPMGGFGAEKDWPLVVLVDDLPLNLKVMNRFLSKSYRVEMAKDGLVALQLIRSRMAGVGQGGNGSVPAAVLTDINMPKMSGLELAKELRKLGFQGLIVGITGDITKSEEEFEEAGFDKILKKPCRPNTILATLASFQLIQNKEDSAAETL